MNVTTRTILLASVGAFGAIFGLACGGNDTPDEAASPAAGGTTATAAVSATASNGSGSLTVTARDFAFSPTNLKAPAGQPITLAFKNEDSGASHSLSVQIEGAAKKTCVGPCTTEETLPGQPAGTYEYFCNIHSNMKGTLTVE